MEWNKAYWKQLKKVILDSFPCLDLKLIFKNPLTVGSMFRFKDSLPELMRSSVVYMFTCPRCNLGNYVGSTKRLLKVRIDAHRGVSHRTGCTLNTKEFSTIREHTYKCKVNISYKHFKIIAQAPSNSSLLVLESLAIKQQAPKLNNQLSSVPLHIAWAG